MPRPMLAILAALVLLVPETRAEATPLTPLQAALDALAGMAAYSHKPGYSEAISDLFLGYDAEGKPRVAVALRSFKTYEKVTAMAVVRDRDGTFVVERADIPDAAAIKASDKRDKVTGAIQAITGKTVKTPSGEVSGIDAATGATRYQARIYASFDLLVKAALTELEANPDWPRSPLPPAGTTPSVPGAP